MNPNNEEPFEKFLNEAYEAFNRKDWNLAIDKFTKALQIHLFEDALLNRGNAYFFLLKLDEALSDYNKLLEISPEEFGAFLGKANIYKSKKQFSNALSNYIQAYKYKPPDFNDSYIFFSLGECLFQMKSTFEPAIYFYGKALDVGIEGELRLKIHNDIMVSYGRLGMHKEAIEYYNEKLEKEYKDDPNVLISYGISLTSIGYNEEAIEAFNKAEKPENPNPFVYINRAIPYMNRGSSKSNIEDIKHAEEDFRRGIELAEKDKSRDHSGLIAFAKKFLEIDIPRIRKEIEEKLK